MWKNALADRSGRRTTLGEISRPIATLTESGAVRNDWRAIDPLNREYSNDRF